MKLGMPEAIRKQARYQMGGGSVVSGATSTCESKPRRRRMLCYCELESPLRTSWIDENPGRRFYGCGLYSIKGRKGCDFFDWHDDEINAREKKIIRGLLRKLDESKKREKFFVGFIVLSWVITLVLVFAFAFVKK